MTDFLRKARLAMDDLVQFFNILSDETRLRILTLLAGQELCVCELAEILNVPQPKVSRHLGKLRDVGLVKDMRRGQWVFYGLTANEPLEQDILAMIVQQREKYPVLLADAKGLELRRREGKMCSRTGSREEQKLV
ncbi:HTH ArsR-type DNA-binding domain protein [Acididesulfobacillus acetoxydans]|uniref:HTH ArsR-type DNA-binding domain protein n=1 Tax=Acididesulfobacillus acetoxydans TaxID=1561005 RepID=A0A8S0WG07_9FIRM|nr:metalloregulator ArsR/SmtB family transcription factor [Acididesulfobacillus acetoxydans]CAA7601492.1 HTH ArsR-type DNA-binding domain protein [Acididesulfobacillus acetoxydans]CEJ06147.1 helix_turn_helix, Arsenical Resistance Operon Repressor [Acididesulfobacillus acetoxydans]